MAQEIERKFLVKGDYKPFVVKSSRIIQGYLSTIAERTVRIRIKDEKGFLTIKGISNESGTSRYEWEKEIPLNEVKELLELCEAGIIDKTRFIVPANGDLFFEIDEFYGDNQGLTIAEIELPTEDTPYIKPDWLGAEVTGDVRYFNSNIMKHPFNEW